LDAADLHQQDIVPHEDVMSREEFFIAIASVMGIAGTDF
jgi:hypothetical protein